MKTIKLPLGNRVKKFYSEAKCEQISTQERANNGPGKQPSDTLNKGESHHKQLHQLEKQIDILEKSLQAAREEAFQAGVEEGKERAEHEFIKVEKKYKDLYTKLIQNLDDRFRGALEKLSQPILELAFEIAEKILERELKNKADYRIYLEKLIKKHIGEIINQGEITIQLNPAQLKQVSIEDLLSDLSSNNKIHLVENEALSPGDCIIETNRIKIDASLARQLQNLKSYDTDK